VVVVNGSDKNAAVVFVVVVVAEVVAVAVVLVQAVVVSFSIVVTVPFVSSCSCRSRRLLPIDGDTSYTVYYIGFHSS
jgi:hypothetical protein